MQSPVLIVFLWTVAGASSASNDATTMAAIRAGMARRYDSYRDLEFRLRVHERVVSAAGRQRTKPPAAKRTEFRDIVKIMSPVDTNSSRPWWCWQREAQDEDETWGIDRFNAFDGRNSHNYARNWGRKGTWSYGDICPWEDSWKARECYFLRLLFLDHNGVSRFSEDARKVSEALNRERRYLVQKRTVDGTAVYDLKVNATPRWPVAYAVEVSGEADFMVLRFEAKDARTGEIGLLYEVKSMGQMRSVFYPASGHIRGEPIGESDGYDYEFTVESLGFLGPEARTNWFPNWPAGTGVTDRINGKNFFSAVPPRRFGYPP